MIISLRKWLRRLQGLVVIIVLSFILYKVVSIASVVLTPSDKYRVPTGHSVKVDAPASESAWQVMWRRLEFFYKYGE